MTPFDRVLKDLLRTANVEDLAVMLIVARLVFLTEGRNARCKETNP